MKIFCSVFLLVFVFVNNCLSQDSSAYVFHLNKIPPEGVLLDKGWKFEPGDNPDYAKPGYDDRAWQSINPTLDIHDLPQLKQGIGWLRLHLLIDGSVLKNQLALLIQQVGASRIYLNGQLIHQFGILSTNTGEIKAYDPAAKPVSFPVNKDGQQVLAVRYTLQPNVLYVTGAPGSQSVALKIVVNNMDTSIDLYQRGITALSTSEIFRVGVFLILAILHLAFFLFYPAQRANLYFSLYALLLLVSGITGIIHMNASHEVARAFYLYNLAFDLFQIGTFFMLTALYSLLGQKRAWVYWTLMVLTITGIFLNALDYGWVGVFIISNLINFEIIRIAFKSVKDKKRGASIIAVGAINFLIFWAIFLLGIPFNYMGSPIGPTYTIGDLLFNLSSLSIPVATSIYLGLEFAFTNRSLTQKLAEVENLSAKTIAQEKEKQQILATQNETLEKQVGERTSELSQSLKELKETQSQLVQREKMASLGELTAGIAHEIQNPLNFVNNFSEVNQEMVDEAAEEIEKGNYDEAKIILHDIKDNSDKINHHGKRADAIVKGMLQHSRQTSGVKEPTDINTLCNEYLRLSYHGLRAKDKSFNADFKTDFDESISKINIIPQDIGRVLLNLYNNAFYAVNEKKKKQAENYEPTVSIKTKKLDGKIEVRVKDNGNGIAQKVVDKIFQPFFTTKPTGQGTGLGLSLAYDVIKAHGGELMVESKEGEGAEFIIQLPAFDLI